MAPLKRYSLARRHEAPRMAARSSWSRHPVQHQSASLPPENQILRGLLVGLPLGLAIWLALALAIWWIA